MGFAALLLTMSAISGMAIFGLRSTTQTSRKLTAHFAEELVLVEHLRFNAEEGVAAGRGFLLNGDQRSLEALYTARAHFAEILINLRKGVEVPVGHRMLDEVERSASAYAGEFDVAIERRKLEAHSKTSLPKIDEAIRPKRIDFRNRLENFVEFKRARLAQAHAASDLIVRRAEAALSVSLGIALCLGVGLSWVLTKKLGKLYDSERQALHRARVAIDQRDTLLSVVSHDLRNPLGTILMGTHLLKRTPATAAQAVDVNKLASTIARSAGQMKRLVQDLLDVSSIEEGRLSIRRESVEVGAVLEKAREVFELLAAENSIVISIGPSEPELFALADPERILQVLSNLLGNALKFTKAGGTILLSATRERTRARVSVSDNGSGIRPEALTHIFDRYWQAQKDDRQGVGLGLFISKRIIEEHQGQMTVDSRCGVGTTMSFTLPLVREIN